MRLGPLRPARSLHKVPDTLEARAAAKAVAEAMAAAAVEATKLALHAGLTQLAAVQGPTMATPHGKGGPTVQRRRPTQRAWWIASRSWSRVSRLKPE